MQLGLNHHQNILLLFIESNILMKILQNKHNFNFLKLKLFRNLQIN